MQLSVHVIQITGVNAFIIDIDFLFYMIILLLIFFKISFDKKLTNLIQLKLYGRVNSIKDNFDR